MICMAELGSTDLFTPFYRKTIGFCENQGFRQKRLSETIYRIWHKFATLREKEGDFVKPGFLYFLLILVYTLATVCIR